MIVSGNDQHRYEQRRYIVKWYDSRLVLPSVNSIFESLRGTRQ